MYAKESLSYSSSQNLESLELSSTDRESGVSEGSSNSFNGFFSFPFSVATLNVGVFLVSGPMDFRTEFPYISIISLIIYTDNSKPS